eukprot:248921_1
MSSIYWNEFYKQHNETTQNKQCSTFAEFVINLGYIKSTDIVMEWGCGNGRDCNYLSNYCKKVIAIDIAKSDHPTNFKNDIIDYWFHKDFTYLDDFDNDHNNPNVIYSRFSLHSINKKSASRGIKWASKNITTNGLIMIEARSTKDPLFGKGKATDEINAFIAQSGADDKAHYRRFIDIKQLTYELKQYNFQILYTANKNNLSIYKNDNPYLVRVVAQKNAK